jgi:dihydrofolate reductase
MLWYDTILFVNNSIMISIIVAIDESRAIGKENKLLWHIPEDLIRFNAITKGHPVIMGRKTYESIGKQLPNRTNIIITQNPDFKARCCKTSTSLDQAIEIAKKAPGSEEIFIIGGGQIYQQAISKTDRLYLTIVEGKHEADTYFPDYSDFKKVISEEKHQAGNYKFKYLTLEK